MPQPFEYHRPRTRAEALELLAHPGYRVLPLIVHPKPASPRRLDADVFVDLDLLGLDYIEAAPDGSAHIGAMATLQEMVESPVLDQGAFLLLGQAAGLVAGPGIRNLSTLWGAIQAQGGPPEILLALLALEAQVVLLGTGEQQHTVSIPEFLETRDVFSRSGGLVLEACLPSLRSGCGWALERVARTPRDEAIVAAATVVEVEDGKVGRVTLAVAGANPLPVRIPAVETMLTGKTFDAGIIESAVEAVTRQADPVGDFRGSADYRRAMAGLVARRSLKKAWAVATGREAGSDRSRQ